MEIELKYRLENEAAAEQIFQDSVVAAMKDEATEQCIDMQAVYLDTEDGRLQEAGIAFRIRKEGNAMMGTLKSRGKAENGMHKRQELNVPVYDPKQFQTPDIEIFRQCSEYDRLKTIIADRTLRPLMDVSFVRHQVRIDTGKCICELSYDKGEIRCGEKRTPISEVEIEFFSGDEEDMVRFGTDLAEKYGLKEENVSKFKRGLDLMK